MVTFKLKSVSTCSYTRYLFFVNKCIIPVLGKLKLAHFRTMHIQKLYNNLQDEGMSYPLLKHLHSIFNQSLDYAVRENLISKNYATYTIRSKPRKTHEVQVFTVEQQKKIIDNLPFNPIDVLVKTALGTGARLGELLGLSWTDIDF